MKRYLTTSILTFTFSVFTVCYGQSGKIEQIRHGTKCGMCEGYSFWESIFQPDRITKVKQSLRDTIADPTIIISKPLSSEDWSYLTEAIDLDKFYATDHVIGCPNCEDGGESWLEIKTNLKTYKVKYDAGYIPAGFEKLTKEITNHNIH